ncbi:ribonuclease HIII [Spiroplasma chinense]|uniref:Ribonuclease n=1 Tax=Spiroplasma chinense TaxID=216932 RepID=A0A5B9Y4R9_9MOLU|nr:ribonuclease HIII [Spiroplasma chinense]QEH62084.1 ribonuclease HIII [Spiroplasma chinense]
MASISLKKVENKIIEKIIEDNKYNLQIIKNPTIKALIKTKNNDTISIYNNQTVLIQSDNPKYFLEKYNLKQVTGKTKINEPKITSFSSINTIGCDEVGVGDFFGPLVACCVYIDKDFEEKNKSLVKEIKDSKKLTEEQIYSIFDRVSFKVKYHAYIMDNKEYNLLQNKYQNIHILKAICHNNALLKLTQNSDLEYSQIIMDEFASEKNYFNYLSDQEKVVREKMLFFKKAEDKFLSVALASIIARFYYLQAIKALETKYNKRMPLGANDHVKLLVQEYKRNDSQNVEHYIKMHFNDKLKK